MRRRRSLRAVRVDVGQPLAGDADAVAPLDAVTMRDGAAQALAPVGPGEACLAAAPDAAAGATLLQGGPALQRLQIECACRGGVTAVRVRTPRLRLVRAAGSGDAFIDAAFACVADAVGRWAASPYRSSRTASQARWPMRPSMRSWWWAAPAAAERRHRAYARLDR
jgi:hypothetical protein